MAPAAWCTAHTVAYRTRRIFWIGIALSFFACGILASAVRSFDARRAAAITLALELPPLRSAVVVQEAATAAERAYLDAGMASHEELAAAYVVPSISPASRLADALGHITSALTAAGDRVRIVRLHVDATPTQQTGVRVYAGSMTIDADTHALARFLTLIDLGSAMLVRDAIDPETLRALVANIERLSPAALPAAERLFFTDLLTYAAGPDAMEGPLLDALPDAAAPLIRSMLLQGGLASVRTAFSGIASRVKSEAAWPLPLVAVRSFQREGTHVVLTFDVYGRS